LFVVILLVQIVYLTISWDEALWRISWLMKGKNQTLYSQRFTVVFCTRAGLIILSALLLVLLRSKPVDIEEQVRQP
jgi:hypothetical protein